MLFCRAGMKLRLRKILPAADTVFEFLYQQKQRKLAIAMKRAMRAV
jgi:hypothetical protein